MKEGASRLQEIAQERERILKAIHALETGLSNLDSESSKLVSELLLDLARAREEPPAPVQTKEGGEGGDQRQGSPPIKKRSKPDYVVALPLGSSIPTDELARLKVEIELMDQKDFNGVGVAFIKTWYPKTCKTPQWHALSLALQKKFNKGRYQIAGYAAHIALTYGKARKNGKTPRAQLE